MLTPAAELAAAHRLVKAVQETPETLDELENYYAPANYSRRLY